MKSSVRKAVKKSRTKFYSTKLVKSNGKQKETYQVFNKLLGKQNGRRPLPEHTDEKELANLFKTYFYIKIINVRNTISEDLAQSNDKSPLVILSQSVDDRLVSFTQLTDQEILDN